ncbi:MAG: hypothetical protein ACP5TL_00630 [Candidatus Micrarchaeia archaeon]
MATIAKLKNSREKNSDTVITIAVISFMFKNMLAVRRNIPPASLKVGKAAKIGIRNAMTKAKEKDNISFMFAEYVLYVYASTFVMISPI